MFSKILLALWVIFDKWLWRLFMYIVLFYMFWLFIQSIDAHVKTQLTWWDNLGV